MPSMASASGLRKSPSTSSTSTSFSPARLSARLIAQKVLPALGWAEQISTERRRSSGDAAAPSMSASSWCLISRNSSARPVTGPSGTMKPACGERGAVDLGDGAGASAARRPARRRRGDAVDRRGGAARSGPAPARARARLGLGAGAAPARARAARRRNRRARRRARAATGGCAWPSRSSCHRASLPEFDQDQHRPAGARARAGAAEPDQALAAARALGARSPPR